MDVVRGRKSWEVCANRAIRMLRAAVDVISAWLLKDRDAFLEVHFGSGTGAKTRETRERSDFSTLVALVSCIVITWWPLSTAPIPGQASIVVVV